MSLKYRVTNDEYQKLDEAIQNLYAKDGDGYKMQVQGAVEKSKLDEFRDNNIDLEKKLEKYKGVDLEKLKAAEEEAKKLREQQLIKDNDIDTLLNERMAAIESDYKAKMATLEANLTDVQSKYQQTVTKREIDDAALKAFGAHKINPDANEAVLALVKNKFQLDNGKVVAKDGDTILTGKNGNLTIDEFIGSLPDAFKIPSSGGGGAGGSGGTTDTNLTGRDKIAAGLKALK